MPKVDLDRAFLEQVYRGPDLEGFGRFVARAAVDPQFFVYAERPKTLGIVEQYQSNYDLGKVYYGHHLAGNWKILRHALRIAEANRIDSFLYPIRSGQPNTFELYDVLTRRYGFEPYQAVLVKRFER